MTNSEAIEKLDLMAQLMASWIGEWEEHVLIHGTPLDEAQLADATRIGVKHPQKVKLLKVPSIPMPPYPVIHSTFVETKIFHPNAFAFCARYGLLIRSCSWGQRHWVAHELAHTAQYERSGGIDSCVRQYLYECLTVGYENSSMEKEADAAVENLLKTDAAT